MRPAGFDAPWLRPLAAVLDRLLAPALEGDWTRVLGSLNEQAERAGLVTMQGLPIRFVDAGNVQAPAYEAHIGATGEVPTRTGEGAWHDFFNALMWLSLPRTKARLNELQALAIARDGIGASRGGLRDAATLFDENAVIVIAPRDALLAAWRRHDWRALLVESGDEFAATALPLLFGHALLDKLRAPFKAVCAHAWVLERPPTLPPSSRPDDGRAWFDQIDRPLAASLDEHRLRAGAFLPLPVLGIAGWWPANRDPAFYDDPSVFRPPRRRPIANPVLSQTEKQS